MKTRLHRQMPLLTADRQAAVALKHLLARIKDEPRLSRLIGDGTQTFDLATEAYASLTGFDLGELREALIPTGERA